MNKLNQIEATDEQIEGKFYTRSKYLGQPIRSNFQIEGMSSNLRGETIPMAYSDYSLDERNTINNLIQNSNTNNSSSNNVNLGKNMQRKKEWFEPTTEAEYQIVSRIRKQKIRKKFRCESKSERFPIKTKKKHNQEENFNRSSNQYFMSEDFVSHSSYTAQPKEAPSTEVMSSIRRGETILMAWPCFLIE
jgi:hypothetical protein